MLGASWIAGVAAVWLLHIGQFGSCDVRGTGGRACWRLVAGWPGQRLAAGGGSASSGSLTQAEKTESPGQPLGLGSWFPGSGRRRRPWRGDARSVRWPCGYWPGSARSHLGSPLGADWSCTFAWPSLCMCGRARSVSSGVPAAYPGLSSMSLALATRRATRPLPLDYADRRDRQQARTGDVRGKGIGYPTGADTPSRRSS
jgi:hypothetical protein